MKTKLFPIAVLALFAIALIACDPSSGGGDSAPPPGSGGTGGGTPPHTPGTPPPPTTHTVTFDTRGGDTLNFTQSVAAGGFATEPLTPPSRAGFSFMGWFTNAQFTDTFNFLTTFITGPITVFAGWDPGILNTNYSYFTFEWSNSPLGWRVTGFASIPVNPAITIPTVLADGIPVVAVANNAFDSLFSGLVLTGVSIPVNVTEIGSFAFADNDLTSVSIPNYVTTIGMGVFYGNDLTSVSIPNNVTNIGDFAFFDNDLSSVSIPNSVTNIGMSAFSNNNLSSVTIPNNVTDIGVNAFRNNIPGITSVTIGSSVTNIGANAFFDNDLTSVSIPNSVTNIGDFAFANNSPSLTSVSIGSGLTTIPSGAFTPNSSITTVNIPHDNVTITPNAFIGNPVGLITIGDNVNIMADSSMGIHGMEFRDFYDNVNGQLAGTYTWDGTAWNWAP